MAGPAPSGRRSRGLRYPEAVEQALCFGWIDGLHRGNGPGSSLLRFTPRTTRSRWSRVNRQRAARMTELGQMTEHGQAAIDRAKAAGTWQALPDQQRLTIPRDLQAQLDDWTTPPRRTSRASRRTPGN